MQWNLGFGSDDEEEKARVQSLLEKAGKNPALRRDPGVAWNQNVMASFMANTGCMAFNFNDGGGVTEESICKHLVFARDVLHPYMRQACEQSVGARREFMEMTRCTTVDGGGLLYASKHSGQQNTQLICAMTTAEWGKDSKGFMEAYRRQSFARHHVIARKSAMTYRSGDCEHH